MVKEDIVKVELNAAMLQEAKEQSVWLKENKFGSKTRRVNEDIDIIGSLAHQAVETKLNDLGLFYESTRQVKFERGDIFDLKYENDFLDIKGSKGTPDEKYFYNREFCVFQAQLDDPKIEAISHFCFVEVSPDWDEAFIYGVIPVSEFLETAAEKPTNEHWKYASKSVRAYHLRPFLDYVFRSPKRSIYPLTR